MRRYTTRTIYIVTRLFELRFAGKLISSEMRYGYFWEWCERVENKNPYRYADEETTQVLNEILNQDEKDNYNRTDE